MPATKFDQRSLQEIAQEAIDIQDASNISGVALRFFQALSDLRGLPECTGNAWLNAHPITALYLDKLASFSPYRAGSDEFSRVYATRKGMAKRGA
jgi:hypothetical protein